MKEIILSLCEGPHDVAFVYRTLRSYGFEHFNKRIEDYPSPIGDFLKKEAHKENLEQLTLEELRLGLLPSCAMQHGNSLVLLYALGGDTRKPQRKRLIDTIRSFSPGEHDSREFIIGEPMSYKVLYFYDADQMGVDKRLKDISDEISEFFCSDVAAISGNGECVTSGGITVGAYIFANEEGTGTLENILLPLMIRDNEAIFEAAETFIDHHHTPERMSRLKIKTGNDGKPKEEREKKKGKFDRSKSLIGIVGQLQNPGATNQVTIQHSDYLTLRKIQSSPICNDIARMFLNTPDKDDSPAIGLPR